MIPRESKPPRDYEVFDLVLHRGDAIELARLLSVSPQLIRSWCRPPETDDEFKQTGKFNPLSRLRTLIAMVKEDDGEAKRAYPIGDYIAGLLGGVFVPSPAPAATPTSDAVAHIATILKESGETVEAFRMAWFEKSPGKIDNQEARKVLAEIDQAIGALVNLKRFVDRHER